MTEREKIVAWLREQDGEYLKLAMLDYAAAYRQAADAISRGDHLAQPQPAKE